MDLRSFDLNLLTAFEALLKERSVSRAAVRAGVRQPAMSEALARLRHRLGDPLFVRAAGAMQPTPLALRLAPGVVGALDRLRQTLGEGLAFVPSQEERRFVLASTDYTSAVLMPPLAERVEQEAPNVDLHVTGYDKDAIGGMLERAEVVLALGVFPKPPEGAVCKALFEEHFLGVVRRDHPLRARGAPDAASFAAARHALVSMRRDARGALDDALAIRGLSRRVAFVTPHMASLLDALQRTDLVAAVPSRLAAALPPALTTFPIPLDVPSWRVEMLWNPVTRADQASAWLRQTVERVSRELEPASLQEATPSVGVRAAVGRSPARRA